MTDKPLSNFVILREIIDHYRQTADSFTGDYRPLQTSRRQRTSTSDQCAIPLLSQVVKNRVVKPTLFWHLKCCQEAPPLHSNCTYYIGSLVKLATRPH